MCNRKGFASNEMTLVFVWIHFPFLSFWGARHQGLKVFICLEILLSKLCVEVHVHQPSFVRQFIASFVWCLCDLVPSVAGAVVYFLNLSAMAWPDACHHVWSKLPRCLRDALSCEGSIPSPDVLAYLFDSEQELDSLLMQFSVLVPIDMRRDARAALLELQFYASSLVQTLHRRRALVPDSTKFMRVMQSSKRAKTALEPYTQTWLAQSGAKQQLGKFRSRRVRQLARVEGASGRAEVEDRELSRWRQG